MKKLMTLLLIGTLVLAGSAYAFADDTTTCELDPEVYEKVLAIKDEFIAEKVADGTLTAEEASAILEALSTQSGHDELRDLGFGIWMQENGYMDELFDLLPHKGNGSHLRSNFNDENFVRGAGMGGQGFMNYENLTDEQKAELEALHAERYEQMQNGEFGSRGMGRRGRN